MTTGDNIYASKRFLLWTAETGDEDDDWFFTYFQPYRYVLNRVPVVPVDRQPRHAGDGGTRRPRAGDGQLLPALSGLPGRKRPDARRSVRGCSTAFGFRRTSSSCASIRRRRTSSAAAGCSNIRSTGSSCSGRFLPREQDGVRWRIPFGHHPPFCAGPQHRNTDRMEPLVRLFEAGGVRACFSGHEHNFQHSRWNGIDYFVSGAGSKIRRRAPRWFEDAHTETWSGECHFLLVTIDGTDDDGPRHRGERGRSGRRHPPTQPRR